MPGEVAYAAEVMSGYPGDWALCGGWAVDAWLGRQTRDHVDVDIAVFQDERRALFEHLAGWQLVADDTSDERSKPWNGRTLSLPGHIHARFPATGEPLPEPGTALTASEGWRLEFEMNDRSRGDWVLKWEPRIAVLLTRCVRLSVWGVPTVAPEVLLFYKAADLRPRDQVDFAALLPHLTDDQRAWLRGAISVVGHPWLALLSQGGSSSPA
jgi:hypothetical protein